MFNWLKNLFGSKHQPGSTGYAKDEYRKLFAQSYEAYKLARRDRPQIHFQPNPYSGDAAVLTSYDLMNRRVRDLVRNTSQSKKISAAITDQVVGTGIQTFIWPFEPYELLKISQELETLESGNLGPRLTHALESDSLFERWAKDEKQSDWEERLSFTDIQRMLMSESIQVGTGLLVQCMKKDFKTVPLCYQLIEREQLNVNMDRPWTETENKVVGGVELTRDNIVVGYNVYLDHPHEFFGGSGGTSLLGTGSPSAAGLREEFIPAERVIDLSLFHRPSASLGVSWYDAIGQSISDRDSYIDSEIRSAAVDAVFAFVAHLHDADQHGGIGMADGSDDNDEYGNRAYKVGHSPVAQVIGTDEKIEMVHASRPNKDAPSFIALQDRDIAAGVGLSYYGLTGDYANTNFTSARAAKLDEEMHIRPLQQWYGNKVVRRVRQQFNRMAAAMGLFKTLSASEFLANQNRYQEMDTIGPTRDLLDPMREGEALLTRLRSGLLSYKQACAMQGHHWIRQLMQIAIERKVAKVFGVSLDFAKNSTGETDASHIGKEPTQDEEDASANPNVTVETD